MIPVFGGGDTFLPALYRFLPNRLRASGCPAIDISTDLGSPTQTVYAFILFFGKVKKVGCAHNNHSRVERHSDGDVEVVDRGGALPGGRVLCSGRSFSGRGPFGPGCLRSPPPPPPPPERDIGFLIANLKAETENLSVMDSPQTI